MMNATMTGKFRQWYDGPIVEVWDIGFRSGKGTQVCCAEPATEDEVRAHVAETHGHYGPFGLIRRSSVPEYCATQLAPRL